ncbi:hypothetical protein H310_05142, partial [Aphanomyces invadans]
MADEATDAVWRFLEQNASHSRLWPHPQLYPMRGTLWDLAIQTIPLFSRVELHALDEASRFVDVVGPSTKLFVIHYCSHKPDPERMWKWFDELVRLPVCGLKCMMCRGYCDSTSPLISNLCRSWPGLGHLRTLEISIGDEALLVLLWRCLASSRITKLFLQAPMWGHYNPRLSAPLALEGAIWTDAVAWLRSAEVVQFHLERFRIDCSGGAMDALNTAFAVSIAMRVSIGTRAPFASSRQSCFRRGCSE